MTIGIVGRFKVFCPFCKHEYIKSNETKDTIRLIIDKPCRNCGRSGVDAVELS